MASEENPQHYPFARIFSVHTQVFALLDDKSIEITTILYGGKYEGDNINTSHNGIAVITEHGDLIVDSLHTNSEACEAPTNRQVDLFNRLASYESFIAFSEEVNRLGKESGRLRVLL